MLDMMFGASCLACISKTQHSKMDCTAEDDWHTAATKIASFWKMTQVLKLSIISKRRHSCSLTLILSVAVSLSRSFLHARGLTLPYS